MARIRVPAGTIQKLETVFDNLQTFIKENQKKRLQLIFKETFGFALSVKNGVVLDNDLKVTLSVSTDTPTGMLINAGQMLTSGNHYVKLLSPYLFENIVNVGANSFYLIKVRYAEQGTNLQTSMSSFLYDPTGGEVSKYTQFNDSYVIEATFINEGSGWRAGIGAGNEASTLALAIVKTNADSVIKCVTSQFTFNDVQDGTLTSDENGVIDLRSNSRITLDHDLLDDSKLLMKDRNSTAADGGAITGDLDVVGKVLVSGVLQNVDNAEGFSTNKMLAVYDDTIGGSSPTNTPMVTWQSVRVGMPWNSGNLSNDTASFLSLHRTAQDMHHSGTSTSGYEANGVFLKMMGSARNNQLDGGNTTSHATTLYFKDMRLDAGKLTNVAIKETLASIYTLNSPSSFYPLPSGDNWSALGLNTFTDDAGVVISKKGNLLVGGIFNDGDNSYADFSLYGLDGNANESMNVSKIANIYSKKGYAISMNGTTSDNRGLHWVQEGHTQASASLTRPYTVGSVTLEKEAGWTTETMHTTLKVELNDSTYTKDAVTKLKLTSHGMLMLGESAWLDGNHTDSPDINYWGFIKGMRLLVDGNARYHNSRVQIEDPLGAARSSADNLDSTLAVTGLTSLTGDLEVSGNTKLAGSLTLPNELIVSGMTTGDIQVIATTRPNNAFTMWAPTEGGTHNALTHSLGINNADNHAFMSLHNPGGTPFAQVTSSGFMVNTENSSVSIGGPIPETGAYSTNHFSLKGNVPAIYLLAGQRELGSSANIQDSADGAVDWFIGPRNGFPDTLNIATVGAGGLGTANLHSGFRVNTQGRITIGADATDEHAQASDNFSIFDVTQFFNEVRVEEDIKLLNRVSWKTSFEDLDASGGIDADGRMFVKSPVIPSAPGTDYSAIFKGRLHIYDENTSATTRAALTLGHSDTGFTSKVMADESGNFKVMNGGNATLIQTSSTSLEDIVLNNIECTGISGEYIRATTGTSYFGNLQIASLDTTGQVVCNGGLTATQHSHFKQTVSISGGLTDPELYIGVGTLGIGATKRGLKVLTERVLPTKPANLRIKDVNPVVGGHGNYPFSSVIVQKNWEKIQGSGILESGSNWKFQVSESTPIDADSSELVGKHFVLQLSEGTFTYKIASWDNVLKRIGLVAIDDVINFEGIGTAGQAYTGQTPVAPNYVSIHDLGNKAVVSAIPVDADGELMPLAGFEQVVDQTNEVYLGLNLSQHYIVRIASQTDTHTSEFTTMLSGSYDPDNLIGSGQSIHEYGYPYFNRLPDLEDDGAITTSSSPFGFTLDITGWGNGTDASKTAQEFDVAYSMGTVNFENKGQVLGTNTVFFTTQNRHEEINVINQGTYNVAVRPLQNGQVVGETKTDIVTAGGGGAPSDYVGYWFGEVNVNNFEGTIADAGVKTIGGKDNGFVTWSGVAMTKSPFTDTQNEISLAQNQLTGVGGGKGNKIEILNSAGSVSYGISALVNHSALSGGGTMDIQVPVAPFDPGYDTNGNKFIIAGSKEGRKIGEFTVTNDITIKVAVLEIEWATGLSSGNPGVIRVYQKGQESQAGTMSVALSEGSLSQVMEVEIKGSLGARTVVIDAWDPDNSSPNNSCSIKGSLELYGQAMTDTISQSEL